MSCRPRGYHLYLNTISGCMHLSNYEWYATLFFSFSLTSKLHPLLPTCLTGQISRVCFFWYLTPSFSAPTAKTSQVRLPLATPSTSTQALRRVDFKPPFEHVISESRFVFPTPELQNCHECPLPYDNDPEYLAILIVKGNLSLPSWPKFF